MSRTKFEHVINQQKTKEESEKRPEVKKAKTDFKELDYFHNMVEKTAKQFDPIPSEKMEI